jgi:hypothetical protein
MLWWGINSAERAETNHGAVNPIITRQVQIVHPQRTAPSFWKPASSITGLGAPNKWQTTYSILYFTLLSNRSYIQELITFTPATRCITAMSAETQSKKCCFTCTIYTGTLYLSEISSKIISYTNGRLWPMIYEYFVRLWLARTTGSHLSYKASYKDLMFMQLFVTSTWKPSHALFVVSSRCLPNGTFKKHLSTMDTAMSLDRWTGKNAKHMTVSVGSSQRDHQCLV